MCSELFIDSEFLKVKIVSRSVFKWFHLIEET